MSNELATKLRPTQITTPSNTHIANSNAVECIMDGLREAITTMDADDLTVELNASQNGNQSNASFRIRAYRNGKRVFDKSRDEDNLERE